MGKSLSRSSRVTRDTAPESKQEVANFYRYAMKSASDTKFWLSLLRDADTNQATNQRLRALLNRADELTDVLAARMVTLRPRRRT